MSRVRRVLLVVGGAVLVGGTVVGAVAWAAVAHGDRILQAVGTRLGRDVDVAHVGMGIGGGVGVDLEGLRIADDPALGVPDPFLTADALELRLRVLPLLRGHVVVDRVALDTPVVNVIRLGDGRLNVDTLGRRGQRAEEAGPADESAGGGHRPAFQVADLRLRHGTFRYEERATGRTLELSDVAVDARQPRLDSPVPVSLRARLAGERLHLNDIESEGVLQLARERPSYRGSLRAGESAVGELPLDAVDARIAASPPALDVESFTVALLGGSATGKGRLVGAGEGAGLAATLDAKGLQLARLPARDDRPRPAGALALRGEVSGPPPGAPGFAGKLAGDGRFDVADGRVEGLAVGDAVLDALQPFIGRGSADRLRQRYPDLFASDDLPFERLSGSGRLRGARVHSNDLTVAGASYEARGEGSLGLDGTLDVVLRLLASSALTEDILGSSRARAALTGADGRLAIPLRVQGNLRRPRVTPSPEFAATAARALIGGGLGEVAGDVLERLLGGKTKRAR
jgi:hypothetical protein